MRSWLDVVVIEYIVSEMYKNDASTLCIPLGFRYPVKHV